MEYSTLDFFFASQEPIGAIVNALILTLFLIAVANVLRSLLKLRREALAIEEAKRTLESDQAPPASSSSELLLHLGVEEPSLLADRITRVMLLRESGLGNRDVLRQLTSESVSGYGALARHVGAILTLLGLLGTVAGLSLALFRIQGALNGVTSTAGLDDLTRALGQTLAGMKTAFGCTLAGIGSALVLSFFNFWLRRRQSTVLMRLEELIVSVLMPRLEEVDPELDDAAKSMANSLAASTKRLENLTESMLTVAGQFEAGGNSLNEAAAGCQAAADKMSDGMTGLSSMLESIKSIAESNRQSANSVRQVVEGVNKVHTAILETVGAMKKGYKEQLDASMKLFREELLESVRKSNAQSAGHVGAIADSVTANVEKNQMAIQSFSDMVVAVSANLQQNGFRGNHAVKSAGPISKSNRPVEAKGAMQ